MERDANGTWSEPRHVPELSSPTDEWFPTLTADGTIYFGSDRPGGVGGTDIWRARYVNGKFQPPENVGAPVNTQGGDEIEAFISADEQLLIIAARNRGDAVGAYDLYVAHRRGAGWDTPSHPGPPINSTGWDFAPRLSPGKSWEGLLVGAAAGVFVSFIALYDTRDKYLSVWQAIVLGLVLVVAEVIGDLFESAVKRDLEVKDTGKLLGGHGGMLDRIDGLLFAAPAAYFLVVAYGFH